MELAQTLVRSVARSFYETRKYLIVDALVIHSALRDDDLAYLMSMNTKDLHRMCGELRNHRMLAQHTRAEQREGQQRPNNRIYYYIDYRQAIDAIKWRTLQLSKSNQETIVPASERKEYFCGRCKAEWTQMEVLDNVSPMGFRCHNCNFVLTHDPERNSTGHERSSRMNNQLKFITDLLPRIDSVRIPDNNFDVALERAVPVVRDATHQVAAAVAVESHKPTAVKGMTNVGLPALQVNISQTDGPTEAEKEAERVQKEKVAQQNALPSWMSNSTITGESFSRSANATESFATSESKPKPESTQNHAAVEDLFSQLQAETAAQEDEEYGSDDEEFEDVPVATPLSTLGAPGGSALVAPSPLRHSMSGTNTGVNSPGGGTPGSEERSAKRVKLEVPHAEESEEEFEFEDV